MNLRPKKLDIFIAKQFGMVFTGAFLICQFVLMMQFLWRWVDELIGKGLSLEILVQFFWYMGLILVPQALPLAILLSSLITFGNLGESSELTAIKAAGISLAKAFRSLIVISVMIAMCSFVFQNNVGPHAHMKLSQLMYSMKQKSPELEIPEGIFYNGIPESNIFVHKKDMETGKLYGLTIYRMTGSYEDQAIILADSGMLQSTADKKHLMLTLWNGEWFENMQSQEFGNKASVPYRRETFFHKQILMDFDTEFNMTDASLFSGDARTKGLKQIAYVLDSINMKQDSTGRAIQSEMGGRFYNMKRDTTQKKVAKVAARTKTVNTDTLYARLSDADKQAVITSCTSTINSAKSELNFRSMTTEDYDYMLRTHHIQQIKIFAMAFSCILFFFIGAPLGSIIRKGGLGTPVIISVLVFIIYYILENSGYRMAKIGAWNIWFGTLLPTMVLTPLAFFVTHKANKDSVVFNVDAYKEWGAKLLGVRSKRHIGSKEVIINDPDYSLDVVQLKNISQQIKEYELLHNLRKLPSILSVFFRYTPDHKVEQMNEDLEKVIENLANTRDKMIITYLNRYPVIAVKAHTRPFEHKWMNITAALIVPVGIFLYIRMVRFRLRLHRDMKVIRHNNAAIIKHINDTLL